MENFIYRPDRLAALIGAQVDGLITIPWLAALVQMTLVAAVLCGFVAVLALILVYLERKVAAHMQQRLGPMRVGPHGILQTVADALKLLTKEEIVPAQADHFLYLLAPVIAFGAALLVLCFIPFAFDLQVVRFNVGLLFVVGISSIGVLGVLAGGWASNNKWSLLGGMRAGAQVMSYELSATLALLAVMVFIGSLDFHDIVESQRQGWWIWRAPGVGLLAFLIYLIATTAECNRTPFDISEGESELVGGFHTEYSGMQFAMFFLAEFVNVFAVSAISTTVFLGGWMPLHVGDWQALNSLFDLIPSWAWFLGKAFGLVFIVMWFRWTFPRLRVDQLMRFEWKFLMPIAFINLGCAAVLAVAGWYFFR